MQLDIRGGGGLVATCTMPGVVRNRDTTAISDKPIGDFLTRVMSRVCLGPRGFCGQAAAERIAGEQEWRIPSTDGWSAPLTY